MINVHAEGELGYVVTEGLPDIPGQTIADRLAALNAGDGMLRRHLMLAPRANPACSVNLLMPPVDARADAAFIILQPDRAHASSGSNSICVTTALLETGRVKMQEPETTVVLETAAGLVTARAECKDGKCIRVHLDMVPAFVESLDVPLQTEQWGAVTADICYGGVFYALGGCRVCRAVDRPPACRRAVACRDGTEGRIQRDASTLPTLKFRPSAGSPM